MEQNRNYRAGVWSIMESPRMESNKGERQAEGGQGARGTARPNSPTPYVLMLVKQASVQWLPCVRTTASREYILFLTFRLWKRKCAKSLPLWPAGWGAQGMYFPSNVIRRYVLMLLTPIVLLQSAKVLCQQKQRGEKREGREEVGAVVGERLTSVLVLWFLF